MTEYEIAGGDRLLREALAAGLAAAPISIRLLVNAEADPEPEVVVARSLAFAESVPSEMEAVVVTLMTETPAGLDHWRGHAACAALWAFTRDAALSWAPRHVRFNVIGLGAAPFSPWEPSEQASRPAFPMTAQLATTADIVRTVLAIAGFPSMTGQIIRLGAAAPNVQVA